MSEIILSGITKEEFNEMLKSAVRQVLEEKDGKPEYYTRKDICKRFKVTLPTVHNWINEGKLHVVKAGKRTLFRTEEVDRMLLKKRFIQQGNAR